MRMRTFIVGVALALAALVTWQTLAARQGRDVSLIISNGLIVTMDRQMQEGQWADLGMYLQSVMLLAREHGLHTCPQEAWAVFHSVVRDYLAIPQNEMIFCGMAIGYADEVAPVNALESERAPFEEYVTVRETV